MENLRVLPFVEQIKGPDDPRSNGENIWTCGAASLTMIYNYLGCSVSHDEVWEKVKYRRNATGCYAITPSMVQDALERGFVCAAFHARDLKKAIKSILKADLELIILYNRNLQDPGAHYSVITNFFKGNPYVNDPFLSATDGTNLCVPNLELLAQPSEIHTEILTSNEIIVIKPEGNGAAVDERTCKHCSRTYPVIRMLDYLKDNSEYCCVCMMH